MVYLNLKNVSLVYPMVGSDRKFIRRRERVDPTAAGGDHKVGGQILSGKQQGSGVRALDDINMSLKAGDRLAILGRNGAGKSTLLRVMAGVYPPTEGEISSDGKITGLYNLNLGVNAELNGFDNIRLRCMMFGLSNKQIDAAIPEIEAFAELGEFISLPLKVYSSGMRMRLLFAIAMTLKPDILLLDEWISAGDKHFRKKADNKMHDYMDRIPIVVVATHNLARIQQICTTFYDLDDANPRIRPLTELES